MTELRLESLGLRLADLVRSAIVRGELPPGTHLVEDAVAAQYGVSRGPVRDALKMLSSEGLLESRRRGFHVRGFTRMDVDELYSLRLALEQLATRLALSNETDWSATSAELDLMRRAAADGDAHRFAVHDLAFHETFYRASRHARLGGFWDQYRPTFGALLEVTNSRDPHLEARVDDHSFILDLAKAGRAEELATEVQKHLDGSRERMIAAMQTYWAPEG